MKKTNPTYYAELQDGKVTIYEQAGETGDYDKSVDTYQDSDIENVCLAHFEKMRELNKRARRLKR